jgi:gluconate 5-dehydrogenase
MDTDHLSHNPDPLFDVSGKTALVTGSSRGIGKALAHGLAQRGCTVVVNGRDPERLEKTQAELAATGATVHAVAFDVTDPESVRAGVARIRELCSSIDILVNNTGMQHRAPLVEFGDDDWRRLLDTNLSSAFYVGREVAGVMIEQGSGGKIVNICSLQSEVARPGIAAYSATKGALKMLTKGMCADLAPHGICVNGIGPGYFATELTAALVEDENFSAWVRQRTPAGRWGEVEDLVGTLVFLCSRASDFVNGQVVYVDGGMLAVL